MTNDQKLEYYTKKLNESKSKAEQYKGKISMLKEELSRYGIKSEEELTDKVNDLKAKLEELNKDFSAQLNEFEEKYASFLI